MKKQIFLLAILLVCISTIRIHTTYTQKITIQGLIDNASRGDTIYLPKGTYYEHLYINKSLTLIGAPTTIDGNGTRYAVYIENVDLFPETRGPVTVKNLVLQNALDGIYISCGCPNCTIEDCTIQNTTYAMPMCDARNFTIKNNLFRNNTSGIDFYGIGNTFIGNRIENTYGNAILLCGDHIWSSTNNTFQDNILLDNYVGIYIVCYSNNNTFFRNTFINSTYANMIIELSQSNLIYYNNFFKRGSQVMFIGVEYLNFWSNGTHGNYWSDYNGTDLESDGIGDVPYYVTELNFDPYPLMTDPQEATRKSPESQVGPGGGGKYYHW